MIKPVNISTIGIEPIKVPHQNNVSFSGLGSVAKNASKKIVDSNLAKRVLPYLKDISTKVVDFAKKIPEYLKEFWDFIVGKINNFTDATKDPGKKGRTMMKLAVAVGAVAGTGGIGVTTKKVVNHKNKKDSE